jgi:hypothetical protein
MNYKTLESPQIRNVTEINYNHPQGTKVNCNRPHSEKKLKKTTFTFGQERNYIKLHSPSVRKGTTTTITFGQESN